MRSDITLRTQRLELVATTLEHINAELSGPTALAPLLRAHLPSSWPPGEYDHDALEFFKTQLTQAPEAVGWFGWYVISLGVDGSRGSVVAGAGFLGPPSADGVVEIGFSVVPEERRKGYASEAVAALVMHAFRKPAVKRIIAHTNDSNVASSAVLLGCGFRRVSPGHTPGSSCHELLRSTAP